MKKILLVEDDGGIVRHLTALLQSEGYQVTNARGQKSALEAMEKDTFDLLLLDIALADGNGYAVCAAAKKQGDTPVIFLTASDDEISAVTGLDMGADDYISKPFRPMELISRIRNVIRRAGKTKPVFEWSGLRVDAVKGTVEKNGKEVFLSALEYRLLLVFINNKGITLSRETLLSSIWDMAGEFVNDNTLTVYIKRLREKIEEDPQNPKIIKTVRGMGYRLGEGV